MRGKCGIKDCKHYKGCYCTECHRYMEDDKKQVKNSKN